jgi:uncharacterized protein YjiS (DUF1127 family)
MTTLVLSFTPETAFKRAGAAATWLARKMARLRERVSERRAFDQLGRLDDRTLRDIGLCRTDLLAVGAHPLNKHDI